MTLTFGLAILFVVAGYAYALWTLWRKQRTQGVSTFYSIVATAIAITLLGLIIVGGVIYIAATFKGPVPTIS